MSRVSILAIVPKIWRRMDVLTYWARSKKFAFPARVHPRFVTTSRVKTMQSNEDETSILELRLSQQAV